MADQQAAAERQVEAAGALQDLYDTRSRARDPALNKEYDSGKRKGRRVG
jgi:hypothetical protein